LNYRVWVLLVAVAVALPTLVALRQVDGVLAAMHPPAEQSYRASSLTDFGFHLPKTEHVGNALQTWDDASARHRPIGSATPFRSPSFVVHWYLGLDFLFIVSYVLLLWAALGLIKQQLPELVALPQGHPERDRRDRYRRLVTFALILVAALAAVDVLEDVVSWHSAARLDGDLAPPSAGWIWVGWGASWAKVSLTLLVVVPAVVAWLEVWKGTQTSGRAVARTIHVVRGHVLVVAVFAVAFVGPIASQQIADVIRRWPSDHSSGVYASFLTLWFASLLFLSARWHLAATAIEERSSRRNRAPGQRYRGEARARPDLWILVVVGLVLAAAAAACQWILGSGLGLAIPGVMVLVLTGLSRLMSGFPMPQRRGDLELGGTRIVPALLIALPLVLLGLAVVGASIDELVYANHGSFKGLILAGIALQLCGWILYIVARYLPDPNVDLEGAEQLDAGPDVVDPPSAAGIETNRIISAILAANAAAAAGAVLWIWWKPFALPDAIGLVGVFGVFLVCLTLLVHWAAVLSHRVEPVEAFRVVRLARTPVVTLIVIWAIVAGMIAKPGYENARLTTRGGARTWSLSDAWTRWKTTQPSSEPGFATPVLFVVASGGGIRAGYWTDIALRCVLEGHPEYERADSDQRSECGNGAEEAADEAATIAQARLFVASGISGGSVGLVTYTAHVLDGEAGASEWPTSHWERDDGAPTLSWLLFADIPSALVLRNGGTDRAEILERSWQKNWETKGLERGLRESWSLRTKETPTPLLVLNGTRVQDGCRFVTSPLALSIHPKDAARATDCRALAPFEKQQKLDYIPPSGRSDWTFATSQDLGDFLCDGDDVRLSTAGLLSARFPVISDSGRVEPAKDCKSTEADRPANVVDGGYFDTSGASPIVELMAKLDELVSKEQASATSCYLPVLLQLDNSYAGGAGGKKGNRPWESLAPALTLKGARDARENNARQTAALLFSAPRAFGSDWTGVDRYAHIYPRAHPGSSAPLGWILSAATRDDLRNELLSEENRPEIKKVRDWLKPNSIRCPKPAGS
jgi:hypothetical protein